MAEGITAQCLQTGEVMQKIAKLYAVDCLEKSLALLFEAGIETSAGKVLRDSVIGLCEEIGEFCVGVIDAIAPDNALLGSVLGMHDGQAYEHLIKAVEAHPNVYKRPEWISGLHQLRNQSVQ